MSDLDYLERRKGDSSSFLFSSSATDASSSSSSSSSSLWKDSMGDYCTAFGKAVFSARGLTLWGPYVAFSFVFQYTICYGMITLFDSDERHLNEDGTPHSNILEAQERFSLAFASLYVAAILSFSSFALQMYLSSKQNLSDDNDDDGVISLDDPSSSSSSSSIREKDLSHSATNLVVVPLVSTSFASMISLSMLALAGGLCLYTSVYSIAFLLVHLFLTYLYVSIELDHVQRKEK